VLAPALQGGSAPINLGAAVEVEDGRHKALAGATRSCGPLMLGILSDNLRFLGLAVMRGVVQRHFHHSAVGRLLMQEAPDTRWARPLVGVSSNNALSDCGARHSRVGSCGQVNRRPLARVPF
jgi:hypothetical protein